jgi:Nucleotidyltransferase of unknown function (DUF6036)
VDREEIRQCLEELNDELRAMNVKGEVCLYGGAVMCLVFDARPSTKDVDAIFEPVRYIRRAAGRIASRRGLDKDWLNYAVKMFVVPHERRIMFDMPYLKVFTPSPQYLLAMKVLAARANTDDRRDIELLIGVLRLENPAQVLDIVRDYYPHKQVKPAAHLLIEELFDAMQ